MSEDSKTLKVDEETENTMRVTWKPAPGKVVNYRVVYRPRGGGRQGVQEAGLNGHVTTCTLDTRAPTGQVASTTHYKWCLQVISLLLCMSGCVYTRTHAGSSSVPHSCLPAAGLHCHHQSLVMLRPQQLAEACLHSHPARLEAVMVCTGHGPCPQGL